MGVCVECLPADKPWYAMSATCRSSGVAPRACVRVYGRVLAPPNLYMHTYIRAEVFMVVIYYTRLSRHMTETYAQTDKHKHSTHLDAETRTHTHKQAMLTSARPLTRAWEVARTVVAPPLSVVKCLWEVFVWGSCRARVCAGVGGVFSVGVSCVRVTC